MKKETQGGCLRERNIQNFSNSCKEVVLSRFVIDDTVRAHSCRLEET